MELSIQEVESLDRPTPLCHECNLFLTREIWVSPRKKEKNGHSKESSQILKCTACGNIYEELDIVFDED
jgi:uncharacterized protein with PIN domain|tara:strand:- start:1309 stop:1515 length:207 start_codon:yes stop_codon:yes gene_type:complete